MFACRSLVWRNAGRNAELIQGTRPIIRFSSKTAPSASPTIDVLGLPQSPPWSVHALVNSYPSPTLSDATLTKLYGGAALLPPAADTHEFREVKREMEDLMRLVEAVKLVEPSETMQGASPPDGRVWPNDRGIALVHHIAPDEEFPSGRGLLKHAQRTENGLYLVDTSKTKT